MDTGTLFLADPCDDWDWNEEVQLKPRMTEEDFWARSSPVAVEETDGERRQGPGEEEEEIVDPFAFVAPEMSQLSSAETGIRTLIGSDHPVLDACAKYFFEMDGGKKIRPTMVLLASAAANQHVLANGLPQQEAPSIPSSGRASPQQMRLAQICELIHVASLAHDDLIDHASSRRGMPSLHKAFSSKLAVLGGDYLLARASVMLSRLRDVRVVEIMSTVIEHLVKGEIYQMRPQLDAGSMSALEVYLRKSFYKTSIMALGPKAAAVLAHHDEEVQRACYDYGRHLGVSFQLIDDVLDFVGNAETLGKPSLGDLTSGLATAPVLFAAEEYPQLSTLIKRQFKAPGDVDEALVYINKSAGIERTKELAMVQAEKAIAAIERLAPSRARNALVTLACKVVARKH